MRPARAAFPQAPLVPAHEFVAGHFLGVRATLEKARFLVWPLPYERTTSYKKGTGRGPEKFLEGSLGVELFDEEILAQTYLAGIHTLPPPVIDSQGPETLFPRIEREAARYAAMKGKTLFSVGGEHSLSQALIPAFARQHPGLSVLHFDAHADMRPEYEGSPYNHACALYPASGLCRVVQVGIRSVAEEEAHLLNTGNVTAFLMHEHRDLRRLIPRVLEALSDAVYITIDLDGFDPSVIPGVGTPQPGGFSWHEGLEIFRTVIERKEVVGVDVMELCPLQDTVNSELAAAKLVYRLMGYLRAKERSEH